MILTEVGGILKPFAWIFGQIFEWLYQLLSLIGIENVAVTVVLFTIVTKLLMTPLTIRQQKFSKLSNKMNPELTAIQEKYKGKKDEKSLRLQQMEQQAVYEKYGTNPTAGCLPMLITLPIMFALYRVIYAIPAYVDDIYVLYDAIATGLKSLNFSELDPAILTAFQETFTEITVTDGTIALQNIELIDIMKVFNKAKLEAILEYVPAVTNEVNDIISIHSVGKFNILDTPWDYKFSAALLIPVLATLTQLLQSKLSMSGTKKRDNSENPMAQSMNSMLYIMPFMSGFMCLMFPICIGIYWVASTVVTIVFQFVINRRIDKMDLDEMIQKNVEKQNKKKEKLGIEYGTKMSELAKTQTKSINAETAQREKSTASSYANANGKNYKAEKKEENNISTEKKSISGYANMLKRD